MKLYTDIISGDELFTDAYPIKELDDRYEIDCQRITRPDDTQVIDVLDAHNLMPTSFDKKSYTAYIKSYLKALKAELSKTDPGSFEDLEKRATPLVEEILANFRNYDFYLGQSMNPDGTVVLLDYRDDGITPYLTVVKHGVRAVEL